MGGSTDSDVLPRPLDFVVPLSSSDRILLDGIRTRFGTCLTTDEAVDAMESKVFRGWSWADEVANTISFSQTEARDWFMGIKEMFDNNSSSKTGQGWSGGDRSQSFSEAVDSLRGVGKENLFRTTLIEKRNPGVRDRLKCEAVPELHLAPDPTDLPYWDTLVKMHLVGHRTQLLNIGSERTKRSSRFHVMSKRNRHSTYDIWSVAQQFSLSCRRPDNAVHVENYLFSSAAFRNEFALRPAPADDKTTRSLCLASGGANMEIVDSRALTSHTELPELEAVAVTPEDHRRLDMLRRSHKAVLNSPLQDPRIFVEFIPWDELQPISSTSLEEAGIPLVLPYGDADQASIRWMTWKPASCHFFDSHHLYTEGEVYQYCVTKGWHFPGHLLHDRVIFAISALEANEFIQELKQFELHWNDCALTVEPSTGQLCLLETIPGRQYRCRRKYRDEKLARLYFRAIADDHANQSDCDRQINDILGKDYDSKYRHMLRYLRSDQFTDFDCEPLKSGGNGAIHGAVWKRPSPSLHSLEPTELSLPVVLKQILPEFGETAGVKKILRELDITFTALEGSSVNCVKFLGITTLQVDLSSKIHVTSRVSLAGSRGKEKLFLVFERATEGNLLTFVERRFNDLTVAESWNLVVDVLSCVASGLAAVHDRGIAHGDLHPGNILVTKKLRSDGEEYDYLLADFGEGTHFDSDQHSVTSASGRFVYPIGAYIAPEVKLGRVGMAEADTYSFGRIGRTIVSLQGTVLSNQGHNGYKTGPSALKALLDGCDTGDVMQRPNMTKVRRELEDLMFDLLDGEAEWSVWEDEVFQEWVVAASLAQRSGGDLTRAQAQIYANLQALQEN